MSFSSFDDFIAMGGYGFYVWGAYGISVISLFVLFINPILQRRQVLKTLARNLRRQQKSDHDQS